MNENWKEVLLELAKKLTAPLAFAVIIIVAVAVFGESIPPVFQALVYVVVIGGMVIYTLSLIPNIRQQSRGDEQDLPKELTPPPVERPKPDGPVDAKESYLEAVIHDCSPMRLVGLDPDASDPVRGGLTLEKVYISLDTTTTVSEEEKGKKRKPKEEIFGEREKTRPLAALEALTITSERKMVLLGLPGTGKSTFVRYLSLRMAQALYHGAHLLPELLPAWKGKPLLPIIIPLGYLAESVPAKTENGSTALVENFLQKLLEDDPRLAPFAPYLLTTLKTEGGLVLFDGLDEIADLDLRPVVIEAIESFASRYGKHPDSRFLITCRTYSYYHDDAWQLTGWPTYELALLDQPKIRQFVRSWYDEHSRLEPARKKIFDRKKDNLLRSLHPDDRRRLAEVAPFPIILTMMAVVHTHYGELPDTRVEVYERCTDLLLVRWDLEREVIPGQTTKESLLDALDVQKGRLDAAIREIAFEAHKGWTENATKGKDARKGPALVTEDLLTGKLYAYFQDHAKVQTFLDYCQSANGLLMLQGSLRLPESPVEAPPRRVYAFPHLTFQEYLAGRHLDGANVGKKVRNLLDSSDRWREVIMLLGEYLCFDRHDSERMDAILGALVPSPLPKNMTEKDWRAVWMSGDLLLLYKRIFIDSSPHAEHLLSALQKLLQAAALSPPERAAAADTLDELGYIPPDLYRYLPIPHPQTPFHIAKYPVTNVQYQRFLDAPDFAEKGYWVNFPKFDENSQAMSDIWGVEGYKWLRESWDDDHKIYPRYWNDPRFGIARKGVPVVGVSWYEANAYCRWLLEHWDKEPEAEENPGWKPRLLRLLTEKEWVMAAGGEKPKGRYPWDKEDQVTQEEAEILRRANVDESGIGRTTPVWAYPLGKSPHEVWDMGGNVWEWQANYYDSDYDYLGLRGGAFLVDRNLARVASRGIGNPVSRWDGNGFRVAAPFSLASEL